MTRPSAQPSPVDVSTPESGAAALRTFFNIANAWRLPAGMQMALLGLRSRATFNRWKENEAVALSPDTIERLSYVFGIYKSLQVLFPDPQAADDWLHRPNQAPLFGGRPAVDRLAAGQVADLYQVRQYLDAQRGGWN